MKRIERRAATERGVGKDQGLLGSTVEELSRGLGWFSIGLGLSEVIVPERIARIAGINRRPGVVRAMGAREILSGLGILMGPRPAGLWSRVAGDAIDLALLMSAAASENSDKKKLALATTAVWAITAVDVTCAIQATTRSARQSGPQHLSASIAVNRSPEEVYAFWRRLENVPRFMTRLESVRETGADRSHWTVKGPAGPVLEWDAEIVEDRPNERLAWRSVGQSDIEISGQVRFESLRGRAGTLVRLDITYSPLDGIFTALALRALGDAPRRQIFEDLRRLKSLIETGEIPTTAGQPSGPSKTAVVGRLIQLYEKSGREGNHESQLLA